MQIALLLFLGGGLGTLARYALALGVTRVFAMEESWLGILVTNVLGCLLFGLVVGLSTARGLLGPQQLLFVTTGFLGAFTTFSTYSFDANRMWMDGQTTLALLYIGGTNILGLAACWLGLQLAGLWPSGS